MHSRLLFELTCFLAIASCSSIWFCKCFSRFDSISSVLRRPKMAFFVLSFFFAALPPQRLPNPQLAILKGATDYRRRGEPLEVYSAVLGRLSGRAR